MPVWINPEDSLEPVTPDQRKRGDASQSRRKTQF
jgi:hypothetical protein